MEHKTNIRSILFVIFLHLSVLNCTHLTKTYFKYVSRNNGDNIPKIGWLFSNSIDSSIRVKRNIIQSPEDSLLKSMNIKCQQTLKRLCIDVTKDNDELMLLECIQNFKV